MVVRFVGLEGNQALFVRQDVSFKAMNDDVANPMFVSTIDLDGDRERWSKSLSRLRRPQWAPRTFRLRRHLPIPFKPDRSKSLRPPAALFW